MIPTRSHSRVATMREEQTDFLSILDAPPPSCPPSPATVVIFPADRMRCEVVAAAASVLKRSPGLQDAHRQYCHKAFAKLFRRRGIPRDEIDRAVAEFAAALEVEIKRQKVRRFVLGLEGGVA
jgi:hypothetical protein